MDSGSIASSQDGYVRKTWVEKTFQRRECTTFIASNMDKLRCGCGRSLIEHHYLIENNDIPDNKMINPARPNIQKRLRDKWNCLRNTSLFSTNAHGTLEFQGGPHPVKSKYVKIDHNTEINKLMELLIKQWRLERPKLIISVHGGIQNFDLQPKLKRVFQAGLLKAGKTAGAWILTTGTNTGVNYHVGEALGDTLNQARNNIVSIGIAPWGVIHKRDDLIGSDITTPYHTIASTKSKNAVLNDQHSHFLLVDNGTVGKYGCEIAFRKRLEKYISQQKIVTRGSTCDYRTPLVCLVLEGGTNTIRTVLECITDSPAIPVVILDGSGRAADIIAFVCRHCKDDGTLADGLKDPLLNTLEKAFQYTHLQAEKLFIELLLCLKYKELITVFRMDEHGTDIDLAILTALLKAQRMLPCDKLSLTLAWNRVDIADKNVFVYGQEWQEGSLGMAMMDALVNDRVDFIKSIQRNGLSIQNWLTVDRLEELYNMVLKLLPQKSYNRLGSRNEDGASTLRFLIRENKKSIAPDYRYTLSDVGLVMEQLMGGAYRSFYCRKRFRDGNEELFKYPFHHLMIWAVLLRRQRMAKMMWLHGEEAIAKALVASRLYRSMAHEAADDMLEVDIAEQLQQYSREFSTLAVELLNNCYQTDDDITHQLLTYELQDWSQQTCVSLAVIAMNKDFTAHSACQILLTEMWMGALRMRKYASFKVICALLFFPYLLFLDYRSENELSLMPQTLEEHIMDQETSCDSTSPTSNSSSSSTSSSSSSSESISSSASSLEEDSDLAAANVSNEYDSKVFSNSAKCNSNRNSFNMSKKSRKHHRHRHTCRRDHHKHHQPLQSTTSKFSRNCNVKSPYPNSSIDNKTTTATTATTSASTNTNTITNTITNTTTNTTSIVRDIELGIGVGVGLGVGVGVGVGVGTICNDVDDLHHLEKPSCIGVDVVPNVDRITPAIELTQVDLNTNQYLHVPHPRHRKHHTHPYENHQNHQRHHHCNQQSHNMQHNLEQPNKDSPTYTTHNHIKTSCTTLEHTLNEDRKLGLTRKIYEFYTAPITKFWLYAMSYLIFLACVTYIVLVRTLISPRPAEYYVMFYVYTMTVDKIREIVVSEPKKIKNKLKVHFLQIWNIIDAVAIILFTIGVLLRFNITTLQYGRIFFCIDVIFWYVKILDLFSVDKYLGPYVMMIGIMVKDMIYFIVILLVVLIAFGVVRESITFPYEEWHWHMLRNVFLKPYFMIYGEVYAGEIDPECSDSPDSEFPCVPGRWLTPAVMSIYLIVANILLISILIAVFNNTFNRVNANSQQIWKFQRYSLVIEYESKPILPPPFILFSHIYLFMKMVKRHTLASPKQGATGFCTDHGLKLFLEDSDVEKVHDFEEQCMDSYCNGVDRDLLNSHDNRIKTTNERVEHLTLRMDEFFQKDNMIKFALQSVDKRLLQMEDISIETASCLCTLNKGLNTLLSQANYIPARETTNVVKSLPTTLRNSALPECEELSAFIADQSRFDRLRQTSLRAHPRIPASTSSNSHLITSPVVPDVPAFSPNHDSDVVTSDLYNRRKQCRKKSIRKYEKEHQISYRFNNKSLKKANRRSQRKPLPPMTPIVRPIHQNDYYSITDEIDTMGIHLSPPSPTHSPATSPHSLLDIGESEKVAPTCEAMSLKYAEETERDEMAGVITKRIRQISMNDSENVAHIVHQVMHSSSDEDTVSSTRASLVHVTSVPSFFCPYDTRFNIDIDNADKDNLSL